MKKLWEKGGPIDPNVETFTTGNDPVLDLRLAPYDVLGSIAHAVMLESVGLLAAEELAELRAALKAVYRRIQDGGFSIEQGVEDVHSQIEIEVTKVAGEAGRKIHTGRSRNDQVALDIRLYLRDYIRRLTGSTSALFDTLLGLSDEHATDLM
ncbi:MAG: argininosuccinate lyase, partial [Chlorobi bacterium]|nr:argininosuccinate lyase [Chlorobiota bacterium]